MHLLSQESSLRSSFHNRESGAVAVEYSLHASVLTALVVTVAYLMFYAIGYLLWNMGNELNGTPFIYTTSECTMDSCNPLRLPTAPPSFITQQPDAPGPVKGGGSTGTQGLNF